MSRLLKAAALSSMALGFSLAFAGTGHAQLGSNITAGPTGPASTSGPVGPGLSRLPTVTLSQMPIASTGGTPEVGQKPGVAGGGVGSNAYGTNPNLIYRWPYTIARVAVTGVPYNTTNGALVPVASRPYRYAGKLWMRFGSSWFVCTASLIKKGLLVTAAHCVHNYGQQAAGFANEVRWYPANYAGSSVQGPNFLAAGPWGYYTGQAWTIPSVYYNGTDRCTTAGIVCNNDIAVVRLAPKNGAYPGTTLGGWYTYGWNGYSFATTPVFNNLTVAQITQIGYPVAIDNGYQMLRGDSYGKYITSGTGATQFKNIQLGSAMTGGSSGGPWLVNFGTTPTVTGGASLGLSTTTVRNVVVGTTSWGYTSVGTNVQGASWFGQNPQYPSANYGGRGAGNIGSLVNTACTASPANC